MPLPQLPPDVDIYVFMYCNLKSNNILHVEAFVTNDLADYLKETKYMSMPEDLAEHLLANGFDTKIVIKVTDGMQLGKFEVDIGRVQEDGTVIVQDDAELVKPGIFKIPSKDDDTVH